MGTDYVQLADELEEERDKYLDALRRVYMWISGSSRAYDEDTALVEARRICREVLPR